MAAMATHPAGALVVASGDVGAVRPSVALVDGEPVEHDDEGLVGVGGSLEVERAAAVLVDPVGRA